MTAPLFTDPDHDRVIALSESGVDWLTASRMVWAPHLVPGRVSVSERLRARLHAEAGRADVALMVWLTCLLGLWLVVAAAAGGARGPAASCTRCATSPSTPPTGSTRRCAG